MPHLSPITLTIGERRAVLRATAANLRDHVIFALTLGMGLSPAELVGLDMGDVFAPDGTPRVRVRVRAAIAKGGRATPSEREVDAIALLQSASLVSMWSTPPATITRAEIRFSRLCCLCRATR